MKHKKIIAVAAVVVGAIATAAILLWQYNAEQTKVELPVLADGEEFFVLDWPDGEVVHYERTFGQTTYDSVMTTTRTERDGEAAYHLTWDDPGIDFEFDVLARDGSPLGFDIVGTAPSSYTARGTYRESDMDLYYAEDDLLVEKTIAKPAEGWYEANTLFYLIRNFPFHQADQLKTKVVYPDNGSLITVQITVKGEEQITVPGGTYNCYKMLLEPAGIAALLPIGKYWYWVSTDAPHYMIQAQTPNYTLEFVKAE